MAKNKISNWYHKSKLIINTFFSNIKQISIDKKNKELFIKEIQSEIANASSRFNSLSLSVNEDYTKISCLLSVPENYQLAGTDAMIYNKLKEDSMIINKYLAQDLNWGEYFVAPEFFHVEDEDDSENISCTYIASWTFTPILKAYPKFPAQLASFITINATIIAGIISLIILLFL